MLERFGLVAHNTQKTAGYVGKKFERLTVLAIGKPPGTYRYTAVCRCDCGSPDVATRLDKLISGHSQSCGCLQKERSSTHGQWGKPLFSVWSGMMARCYNPKDKRFSRYGGRGIAVCERWHNPNNFVQDMAPSHESGLQIERIDNDGDYEPSNCRWASHEEQQRNRSNNIVISINDKTLALSEWCEIFQAPYYRTRERIRAGWDPITALTKVVGR